MLVGLAKNTEPDDWESCAWVYLGEASYLFETDISKELSQNIDDIPRSLFFYIYLKAVFFLLVKHPALIDLNIDLVTSITKSRSYTELVNRFALLEKDGITLQGIFKHSSNHVDNLHCKYSLVFTQELLEPYEGRTYTVIDVSTGASDQLVITNISGNGLPISTSLITLFLEAAGLWIGCKTVYKQNVILDFPYLKAHNMLMRKVNNDYQSVMYELLLDLVTKQEPNTHLYIKDKYKHIFRVIEPLEGFESFTKKEQLDSYLQGFPLLLLQTCTQAYSNQTY